VANTAKTLWFNLVGCVPIIGCPVGVYACGEGLSDGDVTWQDGLGCVGAGLGCMTGGLANALGCAIGLGLSYDALKDFYEKCRSGSSTAPTDLGFLAPYSSLQISTTLNLDPAFALIDKYFNRIQAVIDGYTVILGDDVWFRGQDGDRLVTWLNEFLARTNGDTTTAAKISDTERNELLSLPLPALVTINDVNKFIDRWNRSVEYWSQGIFNHGDIPSGQSTDFIALDAVGNNFLQAQDAIIQNEAEGFDSLTAGAIYAVDQLNRALETDSSGVCAQVRIQIDQEAVMTRAAFLGTLEIENGNATNLENLSVTLQIKDANGNIVNDLFGITDPILSNITAIDGTGILTGDNPNTIQDEGIGSAKWTFIPTNLAAPTVPTQYSIGGTLSYLENGTTVTVPLLSAPITVYPQAELYLDYFHQRDVFADDPFTDDIIEPSVPYSLAVLVRNEGKGAAKNLKITSGQPKIIDNEKGLLIDFQIIGSEVNGTDISPSLTVNFGDIQPGTTAVADWLLKSSLQGKFVDYQATFEHTNSLGKPELSLIKEVKIHELIHQVQVNHPNPDNLPDFLVNETFDAEFTPDIIYFSSGGTAPVKAVKNATIDAPATLNDLTVQITATVENGWTYFRLDEPSNSQFDIVKIQRADGTEISLENIWTTDRTFPAVGRPIYENILHFFDYTSAGNTTYTVTYVPGGPTVTDIIDVSPDPISTSVNAIAVDFSEPIKASSFDYNDLSLTLNGGSNLINSTVSIVALSPTRYQITGLNTLTNNDGNYVLTVNASGIQDPTGKFGLGSLTETWEKIVTGNADSTPPIVTDIIDLLIDPRNQSVPSFNVTFSEKIDLSTFTWQDIILTRNGGTNLINNTVTISAINDTTYRINGLTNLTLTDGNYNLTVNGSGIQDLAGNAGTGTQSETWVMDTLAPTAPNNLVVAGISANNAELQTASLQLLTSSGQIRINTITPTISGELGETGLKVFVYDKTTNQLLKQASVTGTQFSSSVELPSPGARELEIRIQDAAGNTTNSSLSLFADITQPVVTQFLNVPTSTAEPVNFIDVQFSEQINLNTFDKSDISLTRNDVNLTLPDTITVSYLANTTYRINGLNSLTNTPGVYSLKVDATTIQDNAGNSGDAPKTTNFAITAPPTPGVTISQSGGITAVTEGGNTDTYTLVLNTQPTDNVTVTVNVGSQITTDKINLTFTPANWNIAQTVTITAVNDAVTEGNHNSTISHTVSSTDANYNNFTLSDIAVSITDDDAEIHGMKWNDIDGDGVKDAGENGLPGWIIYLDSNTNGQLDNGEISTITDANGNYQFTNLRPGIYTVAEVQQPGWQQTFPGVNVTTTGATIPLFTPTLDIISPANNGEVQINFNAANYIVNEDGTAITEIWVTRTGNTSGVVSATLSFSDGTAIGCGCAANSVNNDFNNIPFIITFGENETSKLISVQNALLANPNAIKIRNDSKVEGIEYFTIKLTNPIGGAVIGSQGIATVTIIDDEAPVDVGVTPPLESPITTLSSAGDSTATSLISLDDFWADSRFANIKGNGFTSVIIDTGIDFNHPIFGADADSNGIADKIVYQYDFADYDADASDKNNHGSHIASIFASVAPESNIIALKVFKDNGAGSFADLEAALQWVAANSSAYNIASVNLSIGDSQNWTTATSRYGIGDELAAIASQNIIINAAAGNSFYQYGSEPGLAYPAIDPNVIAVGAVWSDNFGGQKNFVGGAIDYTTTADQIASFSQRDPNLLDIFAPGILITGANAYGGATTMGGTSQATAYITGVATLAQQIAQEELGRKLSVNEFRNLLYNNSIIINDGDNENDNVANTGANYPRVDLLKLAEGILNLSGSTANPNPVDSGNNNNNNGTMTSDNTINQVHTVNLNAGEVLTEVDFGNQQITDNQAPIVVNPIADQTTKVNSTFTFTLPKNAFSDPDAVNPYTNLVIFGDSLSDTGNIYTASGFTFPPPPNFQGRLSNGLLWVDYFAPNLQFTDQSIQNFAFSGANTGISNNFSGVTVPGLLTQIQQFKTLNANSIAEDGLYVIWAGANDFLNLATDPIQAITNAVTNISSAIATLAESGAKKIVVGNLTDLGGIPLSIINNNVDNARNISIGFNTALTQALNNLEPALNIDLSLVDIFGLSTAVQTNPGNYKFTNITQPLITVTNPVNPDEYAFWDAVHPTTRLHQLVTDTFENTLLNEGIIPDLIKYSATLADGSNLPDWLHFNPITRTFSGTPTTANVGKLDVKVIATDKTGATVSDIFTLNIAGSIIGTTGNEILTGTANYETIEGLDGNDRLFGLAGNDTLDGGTGRDTMTGGEGDDTYIVDNSGDRVIENPDEGTDTVFSSSSHTLGENVENLILTGTANLTGRGNALNNLITGNNGNNTLDGLAGDDTLEGGLGNDRYYVDSNNDQIIEAADGGTDTVFASVTWTLDDNLENLTLTGSDAIDGTGNGLRNTITGNSADNNLFGGDENDILRGGDGNDSLDGGTGNDNLDGGLGDDTLEGGVGNDVYSVDSDNDKIIEVADQGIDTVRSSVTWTLNENLENLILMGTDAIDGTGNAVRNTITGNSANNKLFGGDENDILRGGDGNDALDGGMGSDRLTGGTGNDRFVFNSLSEGVDTITDFSSTDDVLDLQSLFSSLNYIGTNPIADGYLRGIQSGVRTLVQIDADGLGSSASFTTLVILNNFDANNFSQNNLVF
jgi:Ca2+-binding RTX toxin-like protein